jgi:hypothetical protein
MTEKTSNPGAAPVQAKPATAKDARLKAALKANMGRRKAQARARADTDVATGDADNNENE